MEEAPENGKESLHSAHANGIMKIPCSYALLNIPKIHAVPTYITVWTINSIYPGRITNCMSDKKICI